MGGAFHVNGNITPAAEANIWGDAEAADVVFTASWPVTAIGLDVTTRVEMDRDGLDTLAPSAVPTPSWSVHCHRTTSTSTCRPATRAWSCTTAAPASR